MSAFSFIFGISGYTLLSSLISLANKSLAQLIPFILLETTVFVVGSFIVWPYLGTNIAGAFSKSYPGINLLINPQEFLITLPYLKLIPNDKNLGFTLNSLCNIEQTALLAET